MTLEDGNGKHLADGTGRGRENTGHDVENFDPLGVAHLDRDFRKVRDLPAGPQAVN